MRQRTRTLFDLRSVGVESAATPARRRTRTTLPTTVAEAASIVDLRSELPAVVVSAVPPAPHWVMPTSKAPRGEPEAVVARRRSLSAPGLRLETL